MTQFQIILTSIFGIFFILGVLMFANFGPNSSTQSIGNVVIWGTVEDQLISAVLNDLADRDESFEKVEYIQKDVENFDSVLAEAMSEGNGPDIFLLPQSKILKHQGKILPIPFTTFPLRDFKDYFVEEGELFLLDDGVLALPFLLDPMVMYWNRDIFTRFGLANPPSYWDSFFAFAADVSEKDENRNILTNAVALGGYKNISNAKDILAMLILQTGNKIVERVDGKVDVVLNSSIANENNGPESALRFYTEFSNPIKETYSWNNSLPNSKNVFLAGDLAIYFGFASELDELLLKNPNLNLDIAYMPQMSGLKNNITFGNMWALAINKGSKNPAGAFRVMTALIKGETLSMMSSYNKLPPVSRVLLSQKSSDAYQSIFIKSALSARAFLDPNPDDSDYVFQEMVESVTSGRRKLSEAISKAGIELNEILK
ncbi:MAG: extracellular solute-binding protein [Patescibacteria group bacterium]